MAVVVPTVDRAINFNLLNLVPFSGTENGNASSYVFRWGLTVIPGVYDNSMSIYGSWQFAPTARAGDSFSSAVISGAITRIDYSGSSSISISGLNLPARDMIGQVNDPARYLFQSDDSITGSSKGDLLKGYAGNDTVNAGGGADTIEGGDGSSYLRGDDGDDSIVGGAGFDDINGNMGNDTCVSGGGDDWVVGGKDNDSLAGGAGANLVYGNLGSDTCDGGDGADVVRGGQDNDVVRGGAGDDYVSGDKGSDTMTGGAGADLFHTFGDAGIDRVTDFSLAEGDRVLLDPGTQYTLAQVGADTVINMTGGGQMVLVGVQMSTLTPGWIFGA